MLFNSFEFLVFFPLVTILFFVLPHRLRWLILLAASCVFYMYFIPVYILILLGTILIDYFAGIYLEDTIEPKKKKRYLALSIIANVGVLAIFKYYNFFLDNINDTWNLLSGHPTALKYIGIGLPIGLSFHTFQAMSYTFEVYYGRQKAERHFGYYALYVMFYPQLVAGPIERPQNILHQLHEEKHFDNNRLRDGLSQMLWGMFKKVVIADNLAGMVNMAFSDPSQTNTTALLLASYFFAIQIYCDFSGYSDIALGAARVMGFNLMENFRTPYLSQSIREFWSRWHISLSTWFRDYLYIPLGGNRVGKSRWMFNLFIVFLISGFWHGANWTYIIWGALHGLFLIIAIIKDDFIEKNGLKKLLNGRWVKPMNVLITFHLALLAWIFFRANTVQDAFTILKKLPTGDYSLKGIRDALAYFSGTPNNIGNQVYNCVMALAFLAIDPVMDQITKNQIALSKPIYRYAVYSAVLAGIILFGFFGEVHFIYFQF